MIKELYLFDFDGLLVETEALHYEAYKQMCAKRGVCLEWSLEEYFRIAHSHARSLGEEILAKFPELKMQVSSWDVLYREKTVLFHEILKKNKVPLKEGAQELLEYLQKNQVPHCVVTNSVRAFTQTIRAQHPILQNIPLWFTREDSPKPKPSPDPYLAALRYFGSDGTNAIGFEDTLKGLRALQHAGVAQRMLVCAPNHPQLSSEEISDLHGYYHLVSLSTFLDSPRA